MECPSKTFIRREVFPKNSTDVTIQHLLEFNPNYLFHIPFLLSSSYFIISFCLVLALLFFCVDCEVTSKSSDDNIKSHSDGKSRL